MHTRCFAYSTLRLHATHAVLEAVASLSAAHVRHAARPDVLVNVPTPQARQLPLDASYVVPGTHTYESPVADGTLNAGSRTHSCCRAYDVDELQRRHAVLEAVCPRATE